MTISLVEILAIASLAVVYSWAIYNLPILVAGIRSHLKEKDGGRLGEEAYSAKGLPIFSVVIPAKNEEVVLPRILAALLQQDYPREKMEIIVAEDGSTDTTLNVCRDFARESRGLIRLIHSEDSNGKPSALNRALSLSRGEIIAIFDADNIPDQDALRKAAKYFEDERVAALQGRTLSLNSDVNMLTKLLSLEDAVICEGWMRGRDSLGLFVHMKGSCEFVRKDVLENLGGWKAGCLSEDLEMSAKITEQGNRIKYAPDVRSWQETPETLSTILRQRIRWFLGLIEVAFSFGRLLKKPDSRKFDAEIVLFSPFVLIASLLSYLVSPLALTGVDWAASTTIAFVGWLILVLSTMITGITLIQVAKPRKTRIRFRDLLWVPFIHGYWFLQSFIAIWALIRTIWGAPREWKKTPKTGTINSTDLPKLSLYIQPKPSRE